MTIDLCPDWRFHLDDVQGGEAPGLDDSEWRELDLPHDWSVEHPVSQDNPTGSSGGWVRAGVGWYRRDIDDPRRSADERVWVEFDGAYMNASVWINGRFLGLRPYGYSGFGYDLTPHLSADGPNVLAVRVDNSRQPNSRWYTGSGIYRPVTLTVTGPVHVDRWGTYVTTPEVSADAAMVKVRTSVMNDASENREVTLATKLVAPDGSVAAEATSTAELPGLARTKLEQTLQVKAPSLWSPETPALYRAITRVLGRNDSNDELDVHETPIGIRSIRFDADEGFFVNEQPVKMRGVCEHHDAGCVGAAVPEGVWARRLVILKDMGCNAIRTSHNPPAPVFLDLCDRMGFLVIDEAFDEWIVGKKPHGYHQHFDDWAPRDLADMIRRDRNHPCVVLWSIGNEIREVGTPEGAQIVRMLKEICHQEDPTRPVTCGVCSMSNANESGFAEALDVVGYNGGGGSVFMYEEDHEKYPDRKMYASEVPHTWQTRGVYRTKSYMRVRDRDKNPHPRDVGMPVPDLTEEEVFTEFSDRYSSSYDNYGVRISARDSWRLTRDLPFVAGEFRWTGFDYLGETMGWPNRLWNFGIIDTCGFPKDTYHFCKSQWTDTPMIHLLPHWTWPGKEGVTIPVWCYTNCQEVELFLNGRSLGKRAMGPEMYLSWDVPYEPGELRAVGKVEGRDDGGNAECVVATAGEPAALGLTLDRESLAADGFDVVHATIRVLDASGNFVPTAGSEIELAVRGAGRLIGMDSGDPVCHEGYGGPARSAFHGMCLGIIQAGREAGEIEITATSGALSPAKATLPVR